MLTYILKVEKSCNRYRFDRCVDIYLKKQVKIPSKMRMYQNKIKKQNKGNASFTVFSTFPTVHSYLVLQAWFMICQKDNLSLLCVLIET